MEAYEGREPYIFISYARVDADKVTPYLEALSNAGYRFWYDAGIKAGEYWTKTLAEEINGCVVFCPLYSKAFNASRFCFDETNYAYRKNKAIVPIYLEKIAQESLDEFYQFLGGRQDLRLYEYANAAEFVERLGREQAFASCKAPEWNDFGQIQWRFSEADGVLTIAKNEEWWFKYASMPDYQNNLRKAGSTAPWMMYREKILSVKIGEDVHTIGDYAFRDCRSLTDVHILGNVFKIGNEAFWDCHCLTEVRIPDGVKVIGSNAFGFCSSLTSVCIPDSVATINHGTFQFCSCLTDVSIPDGMTAIGTCAFMACKNLMDVHIPDSVTQIDLRTFYGCKSLTNVHIPDGVVAIDREAFRDCKSLTEVRIPDSVTTIGECAFKDCKNLKSVEIPAGAKVGKDAFPEHTLVIRRAAPEQSQ